MTSVAGEPAGRSGRPPGCSPTSSTRSPGGQVPLPLRWVYLHVLREFAQHCGHAGILREQLINE
ncbi:DUF664 domain-containing protein [Micromonospora sp. ATCC 39149]|uniref:mycothiol transferase n=1 Tax=Micromonospora sp. (strain ATCC 39149 / NRRL 15099 / SCC 1413) TaxID=219305 RepID=UPI001E639C06|nr:DUF664 domain-containing protein [Micromonospora sp. ATCC 39149]